MSGTTDLRDEHKGVTVMLNVMEKMSDALRAGQPIPAEDLEQALEFLRVFVDQCHHAKEEQSLFPALEQAQVEGSAPVIKRLHDEHVMGRKLVSKVAMLAEAAGDNSRDSAAELADTLSDYAGLLRGHIRYEESDCFDLADRALSADVQSELAEEYDRLEHEVIGVGRHEEFHAMLDRMAADYLRGSTSTSR